MLAYLVYFAPLDIISSRPGINYAIVYTDCNTDPATMYND